MSEEYRRIDSARDEPKLIGFLCGEAWPYHGRPELSPEDVRQMTFATADVESYWVLDVGEPIALIRLLDLGDIGDGAPQFDLRVTARHRGRGVGSRATRWLVAHLFDTYPEAHRIEANTREDNVAMQRVLVSVGFRQEGRLRESWRAGDQWLDTLIYGILRRDR